MALCIFSVSYICSHCLSLELPLPKLNSVPIKHLLPSTLAPTTYFLSLKSDSFSEIVSYCERQMTTCSVTGAEGFLDTK